MVPSPARILHYYPDFGAQGGIERHIEQLARRLADRGRYEPIIACSAGGPFLQRLQAHGLRAVGIHTAGVFARPNARVLDIASALQLAWLIRHERPQAVHVHIGQIETLLFQCLGLPVIYTFHGYEKLYSLAQTSSLLTRALKMLVRAGFRVMADRVEAFGVVSRAECVRLAEEGYLARPDRALILPNGIDLDHFRPADLPGRMQAFEQRFAIPADALCVSFLNRLDANKNPLAYLRLAHRLCETFPHQPWVFPLAGDGPLAAPVAEAIAQSPYRERFRLLGYCQDVPALLARSALVVFTPYMEGFGLGALEAMAVGTPPLAFAVGGLSEVLVSPDAEPSALSSLLVPPQDENALYDAACHTLFLPQAEKQALGQALRQRAETFGLTAMVDRVEALYDSILDRGLAPLSRSGNPSHACPVF